ncbi:MAG TPA: hypothetical protein VI357_21940 [Mycobacteriales bacterium]
MTVIVTLVQPAAMLVSALGRLRPSVKGDTSEERKQESVIRTETAR